MRNHEKAHEEVCPYCGKIYKHMATHFYAGSSVIPAAAEVGYPCHWRAIHI
jgi:hypothetical protein